MLLLKVKKKKEITNLTVPARFRATVLAERFIDFDMVRCVLNER